MSLNIQYFVNHKTRMCQVLSGHPNSKDHQENLNDAAKEGYVEVTTAELDAFRAVTQKAKDAGWNPNRIGYAKFMAKQGAA